ncbi:MAG TPA: 4-hydroxy-tetrahydrodipicolinate reductase [Actinomycetota bacterium]|jgi:4-hydroxy-tetrahydrodipicolinate reductase|nr:4-hydroxy-tetrahydrodipicolinate reductase [Actinomycetota bacterium]
MATQVAVVGYRGRMGAEACRAIEADPDLEVGARIGRGDSLDSLSACSVALDLTTPDSVEENVRGMVERGVHAVVGTSGLRDEALADLDADARTAGVRVFVVPNFAIGAVLMMSFAAKAAPYFDGVEIVERHHDKKADAPSGTALRTARLVRDARLGDWRPSPTNETLAGSRGGDADGVRIHSLRLRGSVAHQEVVFGGTGETLTIRHDSIDRSSFMAGVLLSLKRVAALPPGVTVGLEHLLEL